MSTAFRGLDSYVIPKCTSVCAPAARLVVVEAWANGGKAQHMIHPVLAIEVRVGETFYRDHRPQDYRRPPTPEIAEAEGWWPEISSHEYDVLVLSEAYGICPAAMAFDGNNVAFRVEVAPWPAEQDDNRLSVAVAEVEAEAIRKEASGAGRRATNAV